MADIDLCDCHKKIGCVLSPTCRRALEAPDPDLQYYVTPDYWAGECSRYNPVRSLTDTREAEADQAREQYWENHT